MFPEIDAQSGRGTPRVTLDQITEVITGQHVIDEATSDCVSLAYVAAATGGEAEPPQSTL